MTNKLLQTIQEGEESFDEEFPLHQMHGDVWCSEVADDVKQFNKQNTLNLLQAIVEMCDELKRKETGETKVYSSEQGSTLSNRNQKNEGWNSALDTIKQQPLEVIKEINKWLNKNN